MIDMKVKQYSKEYLDLAKDNSSDEVAPGFEFEIKGASRKEHDKLFSMYSYVVIDEETNSIRCYTQDANINLERGECLVCCDDGEVIKRTE